MNPWISNNPNGKHPIYQDGSICRTQQQSFNGKRLFPTNPNYYPCTQLVLNSAAHSENITPHFPLPALSSCTTTSPLRSVTSAKVSARHKEPLSQIHPISAWSRHGKPKKKGTAANKSVPSKMLSPFVNRRKRSELIFPPSPHATVSVAGCSCCCPVVAAKQRQSDDLHKLQRCSSCHNTGHSVTVQLGLCTVSDNA